MQRRRLMAWLPSAVVGTAAGLEGIRFAIHGQLVPFLVAVGLLGLVAWALSPVAFPRSASPLDTVPPEQRVLVYWRPGCMYCLRLRWSLGRRARQAGWIDIWSDDNAARFVRGVNDGNETVPTVVVHGEVRTNPEPRWVRQALQTH